MDNLSAIDAPPVLDHFILMAPAMQVDTVRARLARDGLRESCSRRHAGNGTTSIFYCFDNCFLELLWVSHKDEIARGPAVNLRISDRAEGTDPSALPYGIALRNTPDGNGPLPFSTFSFTPAADSLLAPTLVAEASRDLRQPFIFRALRAEPPIRWTDGLQGDRQASEGFETVDLWTIGLPAGYAICPELQFLADAGVLALSTDREGPSVAATIRQQDGRSIVLRLPNPRAGCP